MSVKVPTARGVSGVNEDLGHGQTTSSDVVETGEVAETHHLEGLAFAGVVLAAVALRAAEAPVVDSSASSRFSTASRRASCFASRSPRSFFTRAAPWSRICPMALTWNLLRSGPAPP